MPAPASPDEIAEDLRRALRRGPAAFIEVLRTWFAPTVTVLHEPSVPGDGLIDRDAFCDQLVAMTGAIPGFGVAGAVGVRGNVIEFDMALSGELPDGTRLTMADPAAYTVRDGQIVESRSTPEPGAAETMQRLITARSEG